MKGELKIKRSNTGRQSESKKWKPKYVVLEAGLMNIYKTDKDLNVAELSFKVKEISQATSN